MLISAALHFIAVQCAILYAYILDYPYKHETYNILTQKSLLICDLQAEGHTGWHTPCDSMAVSQDSVLCSTLLNIENNISS